MYIVLFFKRKNDYFNYTKESCLGNKLAKKNEKKNEKRKAKVPIIIKSKKFLESLKLEKKFFFSLFF